MREDVIATSDEMADEVYRVLTEKFAWESRRTPNGSVFRIGAFDSRKTEGHRPYLPRPKRHMFLECSALAKADLLVAGDKDLLVLGNYARTRIVTPLDYISLPV
jgi:uncharacterized protein